MFLGLISLLGGIFGGRKELEMSYNNKNDIIDNKDNIIDNKDNKDNKLENEED